MKQPQIIIVAIIAMIAFIATPTTFAHPGNTDAYWCHTCRTNCTSWGLSYGQYHCHNSWWSSSGYTPSYTPPPTCSSQFGYYSIDAGNWKCWCMSGYVFWADVLWNQQCISGTSYCTNKYWYASQFDSITTSCKCWAGYKFNQNWTSCEQKTTYNSCPSQWNSTYSYLSDKCICDNGYESSWVEWYCVKTVSGNPPINSYAGGGGYLWTPLNQSEQCGLNSEETTSWKCACNTGYVWAFPNDAKNFDCIQKKTGDEICTDKYWMYSKSDWKTSENWSYTCICKAWYEWSANQTSCQKGKTAYELCVDSFWLQSYALSNWDCSCRIGYQFNIKQNQCISDAIAQKAKNAFLKYKKQYGWMTKSMKIKKMQSVVKNLDKISTSSSFTIDQKTQAQETRRLLEEEILKLSK